MISAMDMLARRIALLGPGEAMRQDERDKGYRIVLPGDEPWLPKADWPENVCVSQTGNEVRIVAIFARNPGQGAFKRLITGIEAAGLTPVVVCPIFQMPKILKRWGWRETAFQEWRPPK